MRLYVPAATLLAVDTLSTDVPEVLIDVGEKLACIPEGSPLTVRPTVPVNELRAATLTLKLVPCPAATLRDPGVAEREKSGLVDVFETTTAKFVLWLRLPLAAYSVRL